MANDLFRLDSTIVLLEDKKQSKVQDTATPQHCKHNVYSMRCHCGGVLNHILFLVLRQYNRTVQSVVVVSPHILFLVLRQYNRTVQSVLVVLHFYIVFRLQFRVICSTNVHPCIEGRTP
jgi:hypothetical protein